MHARLNAGSRRSRRRSRRHRLRSGNGENFQIASLSGATSRSRPPITPTAANRTIETVSCLNKAGIEIRMPAISPVTYPPSIPITMLPSRPRSSAWYASGFRTRASTPVPKIAAHTSAICTRWTSVRSSRINMRWKRPLRVSTLASDAATASFTSKITRCCSTMRILGAAIIIMKLPARIDAPAAFIDAKSPRPISPAASGISGFTGFRA